MLQLFSQLSQPLAAAPIVSLAASEAKLSAWVLISSANSRREQA